MSNETITIQALVQKPVAKVWESYTDPKHITGWNFASDDWHCPSASNELRLGGKYSARMEAKDGSFGFDFEATYSEIIPHRLIRYTMGDGRKAEVLFGEQANQTLVTVTFETENMNPAEAQRKGWQAILNNFKKYTEQF